MTAWIAVNPDDELYCTAVDPSPLQNVLQQPVSCDSESGVLLRSYGCCLRKPCNFLFLLDP